jgi:hypothetical protein
MMKVRISTLLIKSLIAAILFPLLIILVGVIFPDFDVNECYPLFKLIFWSFLILIAHTVIWLCCLLFGKKLPWFQEYLILVEAVGCCIIQSLIYSFIKGQFDSQFVVTMGFVWGVYGVIVFAIDKQKEKNQQIDQTKKKRKKKQKKK